MGQILLEDKIGALSHSSGVITLAASRLTIGGQQYETTALNRTIATDVTMTANSLYMIYVVLSGGVVSLRISSNVNSVGPAGFSVWKLVGAFYANSFAPVSLGSFVTIDGPPTTITPVVDGGTLATFFVGFPSFTISRYNWIRQGSLLTVQWRLDSVTGNATSARFPLPRNIQSEDVGSGRIGTYAGQNGGGNASGGSMIGLFSTDVGFAGPNLTGAAISLQTGSQVVGASAPTTLTGDFSTNIVQWSSIPLKDL